jgi:hypothetical protein
MERNTFRDIFILWHPVCLRAKMATNEPPVHRRWRGNAAGLGSGIAIPLDTRRSSLVPWRAMKKSGLLLIERRDWAAEGAKRGITSASLPAQVAANQVLNVYRGIDGWCWPGSEIESTLPLQDGLLDRNSVAELSAYLNELPATATYDVLDIEFPATLERLHEAHFLGFDFGFYEGELNHFSCIIHEIIFGRYKDLSRFGTLLNTNLLFPSLQPAHEFAATRSRLLRERADLESGEVYPIAVSTGGERSSLPGSR